MYELLGLLSGLGMAGPDYADGLAKARRGQGVLNATWLVFCQGSSKTSLRGPF